MNLPVEALARLAVEYWKVLRLLDRAIGAAPERQRERLAAQADYAADRLAALLSPHGLSIQSFDGMSFEVNLPASAVNADEFGSDVAVVVARTIDPAVICDMTVVLAGRVWLARRD